MAFDLASRLDAILEHQDWFELGHDIVGRCKPESLWIPKIRSNLCVWCPPPAAAYKAMEQLRIARHKRQASTHIFIAPRLLTSMWGSNLHKAADLVVEIPANLPFWSTTMHEPLVMGFLFPSFQFRPWFCVGTPFVDKAKIELRNAFSEQRDAAPILKELLVSTRSLKRMDKDELDGILMKT